MLRHSSYKQPASPLLNTHPPSLSVASVRARASVVFLRDAMPCRGVLFFYGANPPHDVWLCDPDLL